MPEDKAEIDRILQSVVERIPDFYRVLARPEGHSRLRSTDWMVEDSSAEPVDPPRLRTLVGILSQVESFLPSSTRWKARVRPFIESVSAFHHQGITPSEATTLQELKPELERVFSVAEDHPYAHFLLGLIECRLGNGQAARDHLRAAGRFDRAPRKSSDLTDELIFAVAEAEKVPVFDIRKLFQARSPDGIIGWEFMMDHCHLHPRAQVLVMRDMADGIRKL